MYAPFAPTPRPYYPCLDDSGVCVQTPEVVTVLAGNYPTLHTLFPTLPRGSLEVLAPQSPKTPIIRDTETQKTEEGRREVSSKQAMR